MWYILGNGPFSSEVFDWTIAALGSEAKASFAGFLSEDKTPNNHPTGFPVWWENSIDVSQADFLVNAISDPEIKAKIIPHFIKQGGHFKTIIHPSAICNARSIGQGTVICPNVTIGAHSVVGAFTTINYHSGIGHETELADFVTLSPNVQIGGRCYIGYNTFIGISATVIDNVMVGNNVRIYAGSVVMTRIRDNRTIGGNPAKRILIT